MPSDRSGATDGGFTASTSRRPVREWSAAREGFGAERSTGAFNESAPVPRTRRLHFGPVRFSPLARVGAP